MFTKNFLHAVSLLCPLVICDTCGGLSFFFFLLIFDYGEVWLYVAGAELYGGVLIPETTLV